jgi:PTH1 family peptidyl-tRNA hydrolase
MGIMAIKIIIGLGNPAGEYDGTRHNAGASFVDFLRGRNNGTPWKLNKKFKALMSEIKVAGEKILLAKPQTFMNLSGEATRAIMDYYHFLPEELIVALDDLDLELGEGKLALAKGPHGHNGLENIYQHLGTKDFWHLRLGIDTRQGNRTMPSSNYVLLKFSPEELTKFQAVLGIWAAKSLALKNGPTTS